MSQLLFVLDSIFFLRDLRINIKPINNILDINVRFVSLVSPVSGKVLFVLGFDFVFDFSFPFSEICAFVFTFEVLVLFFLYLLILRHFNINHLTSITITSIFNCRYYTTCFNRLTTYCYFTCNGIKRNTIYVFIYRPKGFFLFTVI